MQCLCVEGSLPTQTWKAALAPVLASILSKLMTSGMPEALLSPSGEDRIKSIALDNTGHASLVSWLNVNPHLFHKVPKQHKIPSRPSLSLLEFTGEILDDLDWEVLCRILLLQKVLRSIHESSLSFYPPSHHGDSMFEALQWRLLKNCFHWAALERYALGFNTLKRCERERSTALCKELLICYKEYCPQATQCKATVEHFLFWLRVKISKKAFFFFFLQN